MPTVANSVGKRALSTQLLRSTYILPIDLCVSRERKTRVSLTYSDSKKTQRCCICCRKLYPYINIGHPRDRTSMSHELSIYRLKIKTPPYETLLITDIDDMCRLSIALIIFLFFTLFFPLYFANLFLNLIFLCFIKYMY